MGKKSVKQSVAVPQETPAAPGGWVCTICYLTVRKYALCCPDCGCYGTFARDPSLPANAELAPPPERHPPTLQQMLGGVEPGSEEDPFEGMGELEEDDAEPSALVPAHSVKAREYDRIPTGILDFDRIWSGGLARTLAFVLSGKRGGGKSTVAMQALSRPARRGEICAYVSSEEQVDALRGRQRRIKASNKILLLHENDIAKALKSCRKSRVTVAVFDSAQMFYDPSVKGSSGERLQMKNLGRLLVDFAQDTGAAVLVLCQVTKKGKSAGPSFFEHIFDGCAMLRKLKMNQGQGRLIKVDKNRSGTSPEGWRCIQSRKDGRIVALKKVLEIDVETAVRASRSKPRLREGSG